MSTKWGKNHSNEVKSPLSLILSAFASINDVDKYVTPYTNKESQLFLVDLGRGKTEWVDQDLIRLYLILIINHQILISLMIY